MANTSAANAKFVVRITFRLSNDIYYSCRSLVFAKMKSGIRLLMPVGQFGDVWRNACPVAASKCYVSMGPPPGGV
jgi:hypothetical protein